MFLKEQISETNACIAASGGTVTAFVCDDNRTNQAFYKKFKTVPGKPWRTTENQFLLFDYVHLAKSIRNNWVTEKTGQLVYEDNGIQKTAMWAHLVQLFKAESESQFTKLSKLKEAAVMPKNTEKQSVPLCLQVFCDETAAALLRHPAMKNVQGVEDTALFIQKVVAFWKIINVKREGIDFRRNDPLKAVISDANDDRLDFLQEFGV